MDLLLYVYKHLFVIVIMFARISGLFMLAPVYSSKFIPAKIKLILALMMSIVLSGSSSYTQITTLYPLLCCIILEFLLGLLVGFFSSLFLRSINMFGATVDFVMGFGMMSSTSFDGPSDSISATLMEYLSILLFFVIQGHVHLFYTISRNMDITIFMQQIRTYSFIPFVVKSLTFIISNGFNLAIPFLLVFLIIDLGLGIINKSYPSFNVFLFSIPVKTLVFIILLSYYIFIFIYNFGSLYSKNTDFINSFINMLN